MIIMVTWVTRGSETGGYGWQTKSTREEKVSEIDRKPNWSHCLHVKEFNDNISIKQRPFYTELIWYVDNYSKFGNFTLRNHCTLNRNVNQNITTIFQLYQE